MQGAGSSGHGPNGIGQGGSSASVPPAPPRVYPKMPCQERGKGHFTWGGEALRRENSKSAFFMLVEPTSALDGRKRIFVIPCNDPNCPSRSVMEGIVSW